jgi:hypothetical protein
MRFRFTIRDLLWLTVVAVAGSRYNGAMLQKPPPKPGTLSCPTTVIDALKWIGFGLAALAFVIAMYLSGTVFLPGTAIGVVGGLVGTLFGVVTLLLPASKRGTKIHNVINHVVLVVILIPVIALAGWRIWISLHGK